MKKLLNLGQNIKELIIKNQFILYLLIFFIAYFVYLWIQAAPTFLDPDSFYHLKMAKLISERGPIINFPWLQFTVLKDYYIDHHFLYHVLIIPFILFLGDFVGFKFFTVVLASLFIFLSYCFFKREKLLYAEIFALILLFAPAFMFRISLAKASAFSLLILFSGIYCLFKRKYWVLGIISFFYVWAYGGFFLLLVMALIFALANTLEKTFIDQPMWLKLKKFHLLGKIKNHTVLFFKTLWEKDNLKIVGITFLGIILGIVFNPYFPKNIKFYWQQLVEIGIINYRGIVNVGGEWYPYKLGELFSESGVAIIVGSIALVLFFVFYKKQKTQSIFFLITTILFFILTLKSKRYIEYFIPFLVYFSAFTYGYLLSGIKLNEFLRDFKKENYIIGFLTKFLLIYCLVVFPIIMIKDIYMTKRSYSSGIEFERFAGISKYLQDNSQEGEIVMQTDWDDFPMLFYYNDQNYYIVGLDPTFMYKYNPDLYKLFADITMAKKSDNLYQLVKDNFKAKYFIVDNDRWQLEKNLQKDESFTKVYNDKDGTIYKLK